MAREPFLPLFYGDFLASTYEWAGEERSLYLTLLAHQWVAGSIPAEPRDVCNLVRWDWDLFSRCWKRVSAKFSPIANEWRGANGESMANAMQNDGERHQNASGARLQNPRLEEHRAKAARLSVTNSGSGKKGAEARWGKKNGESMANAMQNDGERHQNGNGAAPMALSHPIPSEESLSHSQGASDPKVSRGASADSKPPLTLAEAAFGSLLNDWKRDVPEASPEAFTRWIVHCELLGKQMNPNMRLMQARTLAGNGSFEAQAEVVAWCIEQGYKTLVPIADVRARRDGRVATGHRKNGNSQRGQSLTVEQIERDQADGLRNAEGSWIGPARGTA